jgi:hypothetical protein
MVLDRIRVGTCHVSSPASRAARAAAASWSNVDAACSRMAMSAGRDRLTALMKSAPRSVLLAHGGHDGGRGAGVERGQHGSRHGQQPRRARGHQGARRAAPQHRVGPGHLPDAGDAVGQHEVQAAGRISVTERVGMHVVVTGHQVLADSVDGLRAPGRARAVGGRLYATIRSPATLTS